MDKDKWFENIMSIVRELSDASYQEKVWLHGEGNEVSSYEEAICGFYDDYCIEDFLNLYADDSEFFANLIDLKDKLDIYLNKVGETVSVKFVLSDTDWHVIQRISADILKKYAAYKK